MTLPPWSEEIRTLYLSGAANQFILHGNTSDRLLLPEGESAGDSHPQTPGDHAPSRRLGNLPDFLVRHQLAKFDVVLACDLGAGVRVLAGDKLFQRWPGATEALPKTPAEMIDRVGTLAGGGGRTGGPQQGHHEEEGKTPR